LTTSAMFVFERLTLRENPAAHSLHVAHTVP